MNLTVSISGRAKIWIALLSCLFGTGIIIDLMIPEQPSLIRWDNYNLAVSLFIGIKWSLFIALLSMLIAMVTGIALGLVAGYFQNSTYHVSKLRIIWVAVTLFCCCFYGVYINSTFQNASSFVIVLTILITIGISRLLWWPIAKFIKPKRTTILPVDSLISQAIEIMNSTPKIIIIVVLAAVVQQSSIGMLIWIIGLTSWTGIARIMRAETLKCKEQFYVESAKALGLKNRIILLKHILPNTIKPVLVIISFGIGSVILIESSLSFLGIGVSRETITLGKIIAYGKDHIDHWELVVLPGFAIFVIVYGLNRLARQLKI
ncbi:MAG: ABC transporter permease [Flavobacteriales bacterium]|nr:ABC transporter permease [Flavobacteriales bacterium]